LQEELNERVESAQLLRYILSVRDEGDYSTVVASGPIGSGKTDVLKRLEYGIRWLMQLGDFGSALFRYYDVNAYSGAASKAHEAVKRGVQVAEGAADLARGGIELGAGNIVGAIDVVKGSLSVASALLPEPESPPDISMGYVGTVRAIMRDFAREVARYRPEVAVAAVDSMYFASDPRAVVNAVEAVNALARYLYGKYKAKVVVIIVTTPYDFKYVVESEVADSGRVKYAVIENPTEREFAELFSELGGGRIRKYGYTYYDVYKLTGGNLHAARHVIEYADARLLCGSTCKSKFQDRIALTALLEKLRGYFKDPLMALQPPEEMPQKALNLFMKYGIVYYKPSISKYLDRYAVQPKYGTDSEYAWSSPLAQIALMELISRVASSSKARTSLKV